MSLIEIPAAEGTSNSHCLPVSEQSLIQGSQTESDNSGPRIDGCSSSLHKVLDVGSVLPPVVPGAASIEECPLDIEAPSSAGVSNRIFDIPVVPSASVSSTESTKLFINQEMSSFPVRDRQVHPPNLLNKSKEVPSVSNIYSSYCQKVTSLAGNSAASSTSEELAQENLTPAADGSENSLPPGTSTTFISPVPLKELRIVLERIDVSRLIEKNSTSSVPKNKQKQVTCKDNSMKRKRIHSNDSEEIKSKVKTLGKDKAGPISIKTKAKGEPIKTRLSHSLPKETNDKKERQEKRQNRSVSKETSRKERLLEKRKSCSELKKTNEEEGLIERIQSHSISKATNKGEPIERRQSHSVLKETNEKGEPIEGRQGHSESKDANEKGEPKKGRKTKKRKRGSSTCSLRVRDLSSISKVRKIMKKYRIQTVYFPSTLCNSLNIGKETEIEPGYKIIRYNMKRLLKKNWNKPASQVSESDDESDVPYELHEELKRQRLERAHNKKNSDKKSGCKGVSFSEGNSSPISPAPTFKEQVSDFAIPSCSNFKNNSVNFTKNNTKPNIESSTTRKRHLQEEDPQVDPGASVSKRRNIENGKNSESESLEANIHSNNTFISNLNATEPIPSTSRQITPESQCLNSSSYKYPDNKQASTLKFRKHHQEEDTRGFKRRKIVNGRKNPMSGHLDDIQSNSTSVSNLNAIEPMPSTSRQLTSRTRCLNDYSCKYPDAYRHGSSYTLAPQFDEYFSRWFFKEYRPTDSSTGISRQTTQTSQTSDFDSDEYPGDPSYVTPEGLTSHLEDSEIYSDRNEIFDNTIPRQLTPTLVINSDENPRLFRSPTIDHRSLDDSLVLRVNKLESGDESDFRGFDFFPYSCLCRDNPPQNCPNCAYFNKFRVKYKHLTRAICRSDDEVRLGRRRPNFHASKLFRKNLSVINTSNQNCCSRALDMQLLNETVPDERVATYEDPIRQQRVGKSHCTFKSSYQDIPSRQSNEHEPTNIKFHHRNKPVGIIIKKEITACLEKKGSSTKKVESQSVLPTKQLSQETPEKLSKDNNVNKIPLPSTREIKAEQKICSNPGKEHKSSHSLRLVPYLAESSESESGFVPPTPSPSKHLSKPTIRPNGRARPIVHKVNRVRIERQGLESAPNHQQSCNRTDLPSPAGRTSSGKCSVTSTRMPAQSDVHLGWSGEVPVGSGFINNTNTCYLNSSLQALFHVPAFVNWLLADIDHSSICKSMNQKTGCLICDMATTLKLSHKRTGFAILPELIINKLQYICKDFVYGHQEDAHECLRYLIQKMNDTYLSGIKLDNYSKETTPLNQIFGGDLRSEVTCLECQHVSTTFQSFQDLFLDIRMASSVDDALDLFFNKELLSDGAKVYRCDQCKRVVTAEKEFSIERPPKALCVTLKRFGAMGNKNDKKISIKPILDISKFRHRPNIEPLQYKLVSMVSHEGSSSSRGHYKAVGQAATGTYYLFDDKRVMPLTLQDVLNFNPYILIYELQTNTLKVQPPPKKEVISNGFISSSSSSGLSSSSSENKTSTSTINSNQQKESPSPRHHKEEDINRPSTSRPSTSRRPRHEIGHRKAKSSH